MSRRLFFGVGMAVCLAGGVAGLLVAGNVETACVATNASGQRVVIGTELNAAGLRYKRENPADTNNDMLEALAGGGAEAAWTAESIARCRLRLDLSRASWIVMFSLAAAFALAAFLSRAPSPSRRKQRSVFLSYNHEDADAAARLRQLLQAHSIRVLIDSGSMTPGERIRDFIERSIRESDVVLSLVSSRSLLSAWVAMETIQALQNHRRAFIACYLDDGFFEPESRLTYTRQIDARLRRIEELLPDYAARRLDTIDLNEEKTRLYDLRNNLGLILATLKNSLCLDVRDGRFEESGKRLVSAIRAAGGA